MAVVPDPGNKNYGSATFTYSVPDKAFDFLAAGETLTLTYVAQVDNNFAPLNETTLIPFTITVTGTNDAPVVTATGGTITERVGTGNTAMDVTTGTVAFTDVDLTDRPIVSAEFGSFKYLDSDGHDVTATLTAAQLAAVDRRGSSPATSRRSRAIPTMVRPPGPTACPTRRLISLPRARRWS